MPGNGEHLRATDSTRADLIAKGRCQDCVDHGPSIMARGRPHPGLAKASSATRYCRNGRLRRSSSIGSAGHRLRRKPGELSQRFPRQVAISAQWRTRRRGPWRAAAPSHTAGCRATRVPIPIRPDRVACAKPDIGSASDQARTRARTRLALTGPGLVKSVWQALRSAVQIRREIEAPGNPRGPRFGSHRVQGVACMTRTCQLHRSHLSNSNSSS
jgi:hypothetical protein